MVPATAPKTYSILLAHPLTLVREGLAALCQAQPRYRVVDQCSDGATALRLIESGRPEIAVLDLNLPDLFTLEIVRKLRLARTETRIVVLSARKDHKTVVEALRSGVNAFLLKSDPARHFMEAFEQTLDGGIYISPSLDPDKIFSPREATAPVDPFAALSPREFQVFTLLVEGTRAKEIGARLGLNPKTIDTYRVNLMRKLDIHDVAGLVRFAIQRDLISTIRPSRVPSSDRASPTLGPNSASAPGNDLLLAGPRSQTVAMLNERIEDTMRHLTTLIGETQDLTIRDRAIRELKKYEALGKRLLVLMK